MKHYGTMLLDVIGCYWNQTMYAIARRVQCWGLFRTWTHRIERFDGDLMRCTRLKLALLRRCESLAEWLPEHARTLITSHYDVFSCKQISIPCWISFLVFLGDLWSLFFDVIWCHLMSFDVCVYDSAHRIAHGIAHRIAHSVTPVQATIWRLRPQELSNLSNL